MLTILGICKIFENKNCSLNLMKNKLFNTNCSCMIKKLFYYVEIIRKRFLVAKYLLLETKMRGVET